MLLETPEQRWRLHEKPFHRTGEVSETEYLQRLNQNDSLYLKILFNHLQLIAAFTETQSHILAVGSSADLQSKYDDIDLLICPEKQQVRSDFAYLAYNSLKNDSQLVTLQKYPKGSAVISHAQYAPFKLFTFAAITTKTPGEFKVFDMTFLGEDGGSFTDVLLYHHQNNLAFSILGKNLS
jgi:hypothetical protein